MWPRVHPIDRYIGRRAVSRLTRRRDQGACGGAYRRFDALSRLASSAHAPQLAQLDEKVRVVRGVALDPGD